MREGEDVVESGRSESEGSQEALACAVPGSGFLNPL
jgi:hypothetical protein